VPSGVAFTVAPRTGDCPLEPRIGFEPPASPFLGMSVGILGTDSMGLRTGYANAQQSCLVLTGAGNRGAGTVRSQVPPACPCRHKIAENAGWDCELLAIELPPRRAPGARRPRHSDHRDGKALCLRRRKRWLITVWSGGCAEFLAVFAKAPNGRASCSTAGSLRPLIRVRAAYWRFFLRPGNPVSRQRRPQSAETRFEWAAIGREARASGAGGTIRQAGRRGGQLPCHVEGVLRSQL
jgi:hypothetical protein